MSKKTALGQLDDDARKTYKFIVQVGTVVSAIVIVAGWLKNLK